MAKKEKRGNYRDENGRFDIYAMVNDIIIKELSGGIIPWHKPWTGVRGGAYSRRDGRAYSLINQMLLGKPGEYITFKQLMEEGGRLKPGAESRILIFWTQREVEKTDANGGKKTEAFPILRYYRVYHIDQCEGIEPKWKPEELPGFVPIQDADAVANGYFARTSCRIEHKRQNSAHYSPRLDCVSMPLREQFPVSEEYYSTLFHEMGHSTGHPDRLNRFDRAYSFGSEPYGREELVAELIAASLLHAAGIATDGTTKNNAAYLQNWLNAIKADKKLLLAAASRADKALSLILNENTDQEVLEGDVVSPDGAVVVALPEPAATKPVAPAERKAPAALVRFAAECVRTGIKEGRRNITGAFVRDGRQYLTNGIIAVAIDAPYADLPAIPENQTGPDLEAIFRAARIGTVLPMPPYHMIKQQYIAAKGKRRTFKQVTVIGDVTTNTAVLINAMELIGFRSGNAVYTSPVKPLYLNGDGIEAIVLPVVNRGDATPVWQPDLPATA